jgi:hypothetical protein
VSQYKLVASRGGKKVISTATAAGGADKVGLDIRQCMRARVLFDSSANRSIVLAFVNTWGFDMDDVKAVIEQATDAMGTPPEAPAEAPKPEVKKVGRAAKKVAKKVGPTKRAAAKKAKTPVKKSAKKAPKKAKAKKKKAKKAKR